MNDLLQSSSFMPYFTLEHNWLWSFQESLMLSSGSTFNQDSIQYFFNLILLSDSKKEDFLGEDSSGGKEQFANTYRVYLRFSDT